MIVIGRSLRKGRVAAHERVRDARIRRDVGREKQPTVDT